MWAQTLRLAPACGGGAPGIKIDMPPAAKAGGSIVPKRQQPFVLRGRVLHLECAPVSGGVARVWDARKLDMTLRYRPELASGGGRRPEYDLPGGNLTIGPGRDPDTKLFFSPDSRNLFDPSFRGDLESHLQRQTPRDFTFGITGRVPLR